ncbi:hypothetical protein P692DRAFT_201862569 [Suillus brevipes Sb2]|nr:hypothetical protein P692DRAFT_201862569 [Suillus brevipes Sb2]
MNIDVALPPLSYRWSAQRGPSSLADFALAVVRDKNRCSSSIPPNLLCGCPSETACIVDTGVTPSLVFVASDAFSTYHTATDAVMDETAGFLTMPPDKTLEAAVHCAAPRPFPALPSNHSWICASTKPGVQSVTGKSCPSDIQYSSSHNLKNPHLGLRRLSRLSDKISHHPSPNSLSTIQLFTCRRDHDAPLTILVDLRHSNSLLEHQLGLKHADGEVVAIKYGRGGTVKGGEVVARAKSGGAGPSTLLVTEDEFIIRNYTSGTIATIPISTSTPYILSLNPRTLSS